ncbi:DUF5320 domain-containing protein [Candidatus Latescibacterota bacterium]
MPRGDRTGPNGMGPMTGRGAGYCAGFSVPGFMSPLGRQGQGFFRGGGRGGGRGFGRGFGYAAPVSPYVNQAYYPYEDPSLGYDNPDASIDSANQKLEMLKSQADQLESTLKNLKNHIEELESGTSEDKKKGKR